MPKPRTNDQPLRLIDGQPYRRDHSWWVRLICGHEEPANGLPDSATSVKCRTCLPVKVLPDEPNPVGGGW